MDIVPAANADQATAGSVGLASTTLAYSQNSGEAADSDIVARR
jgi:hypothetical protein